MSGSGTYSPTPPGRIIMVVEPFEKFWLEYDKWYDEHPMLYYSELWAVEVASRGVPRPWLEVGVGSGRFAAPLKIDVGLDPSERLLDLSSRRGVRVVKGYAERLPFPDKTFGGVFIIITLCFLDNPLEALREAGRVLLDGGRLILGFVPRESPWGVHYSGLAKGGHRFYSQAKFYTFSEVSEMIEEAGFKVEAVVSTLFGKPGSREVLEAPLNSYHPKAGFIVVRARLNRWIQPSTR
uniref:Class I SAM-dependent methyltransferase n=1 Tax=Thermogladius calderae TaxID=1200300 RepID=A0A7J3XY58_9CREN